MPDYLDRLAQDAIETIKSGYYEAQNTVRYKPQSLVKALKQSAGNPIIAEVKAASPSRGDIKHNLNPRELTSLMIKGGAAGLSVLTEPKHFKGSLSNLIKIREAQSTPILMKDFVLSKVQLKTARRGGASAVLLISTLYNRGYGETELTEMISLAHKEGLEVLLETHTVEEFNAGINTGADLIGINNRDLKTLRTDLTVTERILRESVPTDVMVVSESGVESADDIRYLRGCGADAYLVGSSIMSSSDPESKVRELVRA